MPDSLSVALQEWSACCRALGDGRLTLLVRKGGIHERHGGLFAPEHPRFLLLPTHLHQDAARLRPAFHADLLPPPAPGLIPVSCLAEVARVWKLEDLARIQALGDELAWTADELAARFRYRDQPWLHLLLLRVHRLPRQVEILDHPSYAGCRSWLTLRAAVPLAGSLPVLGDDAFRTRAERIAATVERPLTDP